MPNASDRFRDHLRRSRTAMFAVMIPMFPLAVTLGGAVESTLRLAYIILGFSLIIFLHELGHFVVARMCSVKCLAFSLGIGPRMLGWRQGVGVTFGKDPYDPDTSKKDPDLQERVAHAEAATTHSDLPTSAEAPPHPKAVGDTDYRLSWLPLGGYVRMLGQDDMDPTKISNDPNAFNRRPIWQRMCIVSAGVIMNVIFAAVVFSIIFSPYVGVDFPPAIIGTVQYDSPGWKAGLRQGDEILSINGHKPLGRMEFTDVQMANALATGTEPLHYEVKPADGGPTKTVSIVPTRSDTTGFLAIGVEPMPGTKIGGNAEDYKLDEKDPDFARLDKLLLYSQNKETFAKIRPGDQIIAIDGQNVEGDYVALNRHLQSRNGQPVTLRVKNVKNPSLPEQDLVIHPHLERLPGVTDYPAVLGLSPRLRVAGLRSGYPAVKAGIKEGDQVLAVGNRNNPSVSEFIDIVSSSGGNPVPVTVSREGKTETITVTPKNDGGRWLIGVVPDPDIFTTAFGAPVKDTEADALNLPAGATIAKVADKDVSTWPEIYTVLRAQSPGQKVNVTFNVPNGQPVTHALTLKEGESSQIRSQLHYMLGLRLENKTFKQAARNMGEAVMMGAEHTKKFILQVYMTLAGLFRQTISPTNLHGIVGITKIGYDVQERGTVWLWYVLAMVSVNLAVANFLPLPIVDGGLFLLLILEKVRGRPLSLRVQSAIQVVGIVLLAGLFLFVTWNDIGLFTK